MRAENLNSLIKKSFLAKQRLGKHVSAATNRHATIEKLLEAQKKRPLLGSVARQRPVEIK
jgi:hypothetical protein